MTPQRFALGLLAIACGLLSLYVATSDVHYQDRNCGTPVLRTDTTALSVNSGDVGADQYAQDALVTNCDQLILRQRFLAGLPAAVAIGAVVVGRSVRDRKPRPPGDIFGREA